MGRVKSRRGVRGAEVIAPALLGVIVVFGLVFLVRSIQLSEFQDHLKTHDLEVGVDIIKGRGQVYYEYKNKRAFVTDDQKNHLSPKSSRQYIVWQEEANGQSQVVLYNLLTKQKIQLSYLRNNTGADIDGGAVVWQGYSGGNTVIYLFDGQRVKRISQDHPAIRPSIKNGQILYAQQVDPSNDVWQAVLYSIADAKREIVAQGSPSDAAWPRFEGSEIKATLEGSSSYY